MDIGKLYETLTGEPYPYTPESMIEASWGLSNRGGLLRNLPAQPERPSRTTARRGKAIRPSHQA